MGLVETGVQLQVLLAWVSLVSTGIFVVSSVSRRSVMRALVRRVIVTYIGCLCMASSTLLVRSLPEVVANADACAFVGAWSQFVLLASFFWAVVIMTQLYHAIMTQRQKDMPELRAHAIVWGLAALLTGLPLSTESFGSTGGEAPVCWIHGDGAGEVWRFATYYGPLWVCISIIMWLSTLAGKRVYMVKKLMRRRGGIPVRPAAPAEASTHTTAGNGQGGKAAAHSTATSPASGDSTNSASGPVAVKAPGALVPMSAAKLRRYTIKKLGPFPLIFVACYLFPTVRRLINLADAAPPDWIVFLHLVSTPCVGLVNVAFFYRRRIRVGLRSVCVLSQLCCNRGRSADVEVVEGTGKRASLKRSNLAAKRLQQLQRASDEVMAAEAGNGHRSSTGGAASTRGRGVASTGHRRASSAPAVDDTGAVLAGTGAESGRGRNLSFANWRRRSSDMGRPSRGMSTLDLLKVSLDIADAEVRDEDDDGLTATVADAIVGDDGTLTLASEPASAGRSTLARVGTSGAGAGGDGSGGKASEAHVVVNPLEVSRSADA